MRYVILVAALAYSVSVFANEYAAVIESVRAELAAKTDINIDLTAARIDL